MCFLEWIVNSIQIILDCLSFYYCTRRKRKIRTLLQSETGSDFSCLVGAGGFEPPKLKAADLQSVPIGHSGTRPYSVFAVHGLPVYITTRMIVCQHLLRNFWIFVPKAKTQKQKPSRNQRSWAAFLGAGDRSWTSHRHCITEKWRFLH